MVRFSQILLYHIDYLPAEWSAPVTKLVQKFALRPTFHLIY